jgi:PAS domain S-box-containing protein
MGLTDDRPAPSTIGAASATDGTADFSRSPIDDLPLCVFRKDAEGRFTLANRRFCEGLGRRPGEVLGRTAFDFFPPGLAEKYRADDRRVMEGGESLEAVEDHRTPAGEDRRVRVTKTPVRDADGRVVGVQGVFEDITERVRAEDALAHERDLLQWLLENAPEKIYFKDRDGRFTRVGRTAAAQFGFDDPEEIVGKADADFFDAEDARAFFEEERAIMESGRPIIGKEERETWKDGRVAWALTSKFPLRDRSGAVVGTIGISRDITERRRMEAELARERDLLRALMENVPDKIYFKDRRSRFLHVSRSTARLFGRSNPCEVVGKTDADFFTEEHARAALADEWEVMRTGRPLVGKEERESWPDGRETWALTTKMPCATRRAGSSAPSASPPTSPR